MQRTIKSFVLRKGRMSRRQQLALDEWLMDYLMPESSTPWPLKEIFGRSAKTIVEIGFGMGGSLCAMAVEAPDVNFIGIEVHQPGIGSLAAALHDEGVTNVRMVCKDAVLVFQQNFVDESIDGVQIFFPDPWPKKRHHKRRLIQKEFVKLLIQKLKPGGFIHCATDWEEYAIHMRSVFSEEKSLYSGEPLMKRPLTKFEQRGQRLGHGIWDLVYYRK